MSKVTLLPSSIKTKMNVIEVNSDQSLLEQLSNAGFTIKSDCGGHASCGQCVVKVHTGEGNLSPSEFKELKLLGNVFHLTKERLSCQNHIVGDVTIDIAVHLGNSSDASSTKQLKKQKKSKVRLKKGEQLKAEAMELSRQEVNAQEGTPAQEADWFRHWEKTSEVGEDKPKGKHLDGNKRPRMFKTPEGTEDHDKAKKE